MTISQFASVIVTEAISSSESALRRVSSYFNFSETLSCEFVSIEAVIKSTKDVQLPEEWVERESCNFGSCILLVDFEASSSAVEEVEFLY